MRIRILVFAGAVLLASPFAHAADTAAPAPNVAPSLPSPTLDESIEQLVNATPELLLARLELLEDSIEHKRDQAAEYRQLAEAVEAEATALESRAALLKHGYEIGQLAVPPVGEAWPRHDIDSGFRRSEGIRLGDVNGDGLPDLSAAWENQEISRVYLNPGPGAAKQPWPGVTVGSTPSVEDALLVDLDADGRLDVVAALEKDAERITVAWGPESAQLLEPSAWVQTDFPQVAGVSQWMFAAPIRLHPDAPLSLVIGGKNYNSDASADLGLLIAPQENPRDLSRWEWRPLAKVSWVMSIEVLDIDGDDHEDILFTDKHGPLGGVHWLRNPANGVVTPDAWRRTPLTGGDVRGANFLTVADLDQDGNRDVLAVVEKTRQPGAPNHAHRRVLFLRQRDAGGGQWETHEIQVPPGIGQSKGIAVGDLDLDGRNDIVLTSSGATGPLIGTSWLRYRHAPTDTVWEAHNIAGVEGIKYDLVHLLDLDADGDLDVLANDEKENGIGLGLFWYENPRL